ncbi:hypothetical protein [Ammoniphilus resinae]|uniref:Uncharacterized protein n=1 Tax=Ammoniphilus resinae TaxID=861532 RepID=A0ABS4GV32_9BACL|nr:hypothetical protein [Ammoniphilus resinae]MBP1934123.1 hypothetical protein [Ammoniphilus resinae]
MSLKRISSIFLLTISTTFAFHGLAGAQSTNVIQTQLSGVIASDQFQTSKGSITTNQEQDALLEGNTQILGAFNSHNLYQEQTSLIIGGLQTQYAEDSERTTQVQGVIGHSGQLQVSANSSNVEQIQSNVFIPYQIQILCGPEVKQDQGANSTAFQTQASENVEERTQTQENAVVVKQFQTAK